MVPVLALLPARDRGRLERHLERIPLTYRQSLYRERQPLDFLPHQAALTGQAADETVEGVSGQPDLVGGEGRSRAGGSGSGRRFVRREEPVQRLAARVRRVRGDAPLTYAGRAVDGSGGIHRGLQAGLGLGQGE